MKIHTALLAVALTMALPALAQDFPKMKPGQWESTTSNSRKPDAPPNKVTMCTDEATQKQMMDMGKGMQRELCTKSDIRRDGGKFIGDSVCQIGQSKVTSHSVMTFQGDNAYKNVVNSTYDPPFMGLKDSTTTVEGKYVGPCRDGLEPGDVLMANGQKVNMKAMQAHPPVRPPVLPSPKAQ